MQRHVRLTPLLALVLTSACGGEGERPAGELDGRALADQRPARDNQQAPPASDQPPAGESGGANADSTCESLCEAGQRHCPLSDYPEFGGFTECVESCRDDLSDYRQCSNAYYAVLRCIVTNGLFACGSSEITRDALTAACGFELNVLGACAALTARPSE